MQNLEPETVAAIDRQVTAFTNRYGGKFPALAEDIKQEAWTWALASVPKYDPTHPGAKGFFYLVASRHCLRSITRWRSLLSLSNEQARQGLDSQAQWRVDPQAHGLALQAPGPAPDVGLAIRDANTRLAALRVRWRRAVEGATADLTETEREAGALACGLDGPPRGAPWIARKLGLWRDEAEGAIRVYDKARKRRRAVVQMEREIGRLEEILP